MGSNLHRWCTVLTERPRPDLSLTAEGIFSRAVPTVGIGSAFQMDVGAGAAAPGTLTLCLSLRLKTASVGDR